MSLHPNPIYTATLALALTAACDCRSHQAADVDAGRDSGPENGAQDAGGGDGGTGGDREVLPFVMFVLDSSGSMERTFDCVCETPSCNECMPDCDAGEGSRWMAVVEAMTGTYISRDCTRLERTEANGATFDVGYYRDYIRAPLGSPQAEDGILDDYGPHLLEFGVATYDGWDTYVGDGPLEAASAFDHARSVGPDGCWSYGANGTEARARPDGSVAGSIRYPNTPHAYMMDTGIRSAVADNGALSTTLGADRGLALAQLSAVIADTRPWGGTPTAAALDDLGAYFSDDPQVREYMERPGARIHVVLLTDGAPDDDYRKFGCDCTQTVDSQAPGFCGYWPAEDGPPPMAIDPAVLHCPYPLAEEAAHRLRCGWGSGDKCGAGPVEALHVIAIQPAGIWSEAEAAQLAIASAGGTGPPVHVRNTVELREAIADILDGIVSGRDW